MKFIKVPFSSGSLNKNKGAEQAPDKIVDELRNIFVNENRVTVKFDVDSVAVDSYNIRATQQNIFNKIRQISDKAVILGGDHSITYSAVKALGECCLVVFDAHLDLMSGTDLPTHEDWLRKLIDDGFNKNNIFLVGVRNWHRDELKFLLDNDIKHFTMKQIYEYSVEEICDTVMEFATKEKQTYVSVDIDVVDPAFAPGTGYLEAGGLSSREMIYLVQRLSKLKNLRMFDLVEVNPSKDVAGMTVKLAAKLVSEML